MPRLLEHLPLPPVSLAADTAYNAGRLRQILEERGVTAYIPIHPRQESNMVARGRLRVPGRPCGLSPGESAEAGWLPPPQRQLPVRSQSEGLPGLAGERTVSSARAEAPVPGAQHILPSPPSSPGTEPDSRLPAGNGAASDHCRGNLRIAGSAGVGKIEAERIVEKPAPAEAGVGCEGFMASIARNVLKAVRRLGSGTGPPGSDSSGGYAQFQSPVSSGERCLVALVPAR